MLELKDICFNVRQDSKEKEILKILLHFSGKHAIISVAFTKRSSMEKEVKIQ